MVSRSTKGSEQFWTNWVENAFPDLESKAYFVPPVFVNRVPMTKYSSPVNEALVIREAPGKAGPSICPALSPSTLTTSPQPTPVQDSDIRDDAAMQRVILCLQKLTEKKGVFVALSQLKFGQYLGEPCYAAAAAQLPSAKNLPPHHPESWKDGDFDVLLIHRHYGLVICEVKSVGDNVLALNMSQQDIDKSIRAKLGQAVSQLDKAEVMLSHLVHDVAPGLRVCKTMALPNLTAPQVQQAIDGDPKLSRDLCCCLGTADPANIASLCLCCDQLSDPKAPWNVDDNVLRELGEWWKRRVEVSEPNPQMTPDQYKRLVARFCGPATTVTVPCVIAPRLSVKTLSQAVSATGMFFAEITLFPEQMLLLQTKTPLVFLDGPPGTGKTVMLQLMATEWLRDDHPVYIVSTWERSRASCSMLHHLLLQTESPATPSKVHLRRFNFGDDKDVEKAVTDLSQDALGKQLHVVADEVGPDYGRPQAFKTFCEKLLKQVPDLHLWAASCRYNLSPRGWEQEHLTKPLRSPPVVVREVAQASEIRLSGDVRPYSPLSIPSHTDGPQIEWIGLDHPKSITHDCQDCGKQLGKLLYRLIDTGTTLTAPPASPSLEPPRLQWKDVLVLWWGGASDSAGIVTGLRSANVPVRVMMADDIDDVASAVSDVVWVADRDFVRGLERKVIVCLEIFGLDDLLLRLHALSRCTSQLVIVSHSPRPQTSHADRSRTADSDLSQD
ncbi:uncharacterized protein LOC112571998 isoform X2 [Pomacea canaliculata]|uniref:uncharacterized protein LOC112571998 isoform X2 n=1 Tax=Pomacea canaliculata TaxID=400727 RepID=UPI000D73D4AE|nr:uncharacterized protein LOC112571998 isoform X2 [Pomacea canaliculata]